MRPLASAPDSAPRLAPRAILPGSTWQPAEPEQDIRLSTVDTLPTKLSTNAGGPLTSPTAVTGTRSAFPAPDSDIVTDIDACGLQLSTVDGL
jgi:hypothetical protein